MTAAMESNARQEDRIRLELDQVQGSMRILRHVVRVPSVRANSIQEMHIVNGHRLCGFVEEEPC